MRKPEQKMWTYLSTQMNGRWDASRHEDRFCTDIPDVSFGMRSQGGWIELKTIKAWPKRPGTAVNIRHLTTGQVNWLERRHAAGCNSYLLLAVGEEMSKADWVILPGSCVRHLKDGGFTKGQMTMLWQPDHTVSLGSALANYLFF